MDERDNNEDLIQTILLVKLRMFWLCIQNKHINPKDMELEDKRQIYTEDDSMHVL